MTRVAETNPFVICTANLPQEKKINMLFAGLGSVRIVKNCDLGQHFQAPGHSFSLYGPPSRQITYIYPVSCKWKNVGKVRAQKRRQNCKLNSLRIVYKASWLSVSMQIYRRAVILKTEHICSVCLFVCLFIFFACFISSRQSLSLEKKLSEKC